MASKFLLCRIEGFDLVARVHLDTTQEETDPWVVDFRHCQCGDVDAGIAAIKEAAGLMLDQILARETAPTVLPQEGEEFDALTPILEARATVAKLTAEAQVAAAATIQ